MSKLYYSIGEVAAMFNVNTSLIRFWEKEFKVINPKKNKKGNRLFTEKDIAHIRQIYHLVKEKGFTLDGAKTALRSKEENLSEKNVVIENLEAIKNELNKLYKQL